MSLQDDIITVQLALEEKPEEEAFERIGAAFRHLEEENGKLLGELRVVRRFREWINTPPTPDQEKNDA